MKEKNNVFIGLAIFISFILLAAAVILIPVIKGMNPDWKAILVTGRKNLDTDSQISQNPLPLKSEEVISFSGFNELSITLKPGGQNKKTMVLSLKDGNWLDLENPDLDISQEKVSVILEELNNIKVLNRINNAKDNELKSFGFDYPRIQVQGKSNGNKIFGFKIGNIVPSGYNCYLKIDGETPVYIADGMILSMLEMTEESLQDNTAFNIPPEKEIKTIIVETPGKPTLTVNYDKEGRGYLTCGKYTRPQKLSDTSEDSTLSGEELVKERLRNLEESLVKDSGRENYSKYGLNKTTCTVTLKCERPRYGKTITYEPYVKKIMFNLPDKKNDDGECCFIASDSDKIYYTSEMYLRALTEIDPFQVISKVVFSGEINRTEEISATFGTGKFRETIKIFPDQESFSMLVNETYGLSGDMEIPQGSSWKKEDELELSFYSGENELIDELTFAPYDFVFYAVKSVKGNSFLIHKNKYKKFLNILSFESAPEI